MKRIIGIFCLLLLVGCSTNGVEEEIYEIELEEENETNISTWGMVEWELPDYSKEGYVQIIPSDNKTKIIYIECINSTLVINESMLYCENKP